MKRLYFLLFALVLVFSLFGCDDNSSAYGNTPTTKATVSAPGVTTAPTETSALTETTAPTETRTELYWVEGPGGIPAEDSSLWKNAVDGEIFSETEFEPGYTAVRYIKLVNSSGAEANYTLSLVPTHEISVLWDVINIYCIDPAAEMTDRTALDSYETSGTFYEVMFLSQGQLTTGNLPANSSRIITVAFRMLETAGSECQGKSIDFDLQLITQ